MGFADFLRDNTASDEKIYKEAFDKIIKQIKFMCESAAESGKSSCRSGVEVNFPSNLSNREFKKMVKQMEQDVNNKLLQEGFNSAYIYMDSDYTNRYSGDVLFRFSCSW